MDKIVQIQRLTLNDTHPIPNQMTRHLRPANEVAKRALQFDHHPFGCVPVAPDNKTILLEQASLDTVNHAESTLGRTPCKNFSSEYLGKCTLHITFEPCVMYTGTLYWANVVRVVFGVAEKRLLELTGSNEKNPTLDIPCRYVLECGQKDVKVWGPFSEFGMLIVVKDVKFNKKRSKQMAKWIF